MIWVSVQLPGRRRTPIPQWRRKYTFTEHVLIYTGEKKKNQTIMDAINTMRSPSSFMSILNSSSFVKSSSPFPSYNSFSNSRNFISLKSILPQNHRTGMSNMKNHCFSTVSASVSQDGPQDSSFQVPFSLISSSFLNFDSGLFILSEFLTFFFFGTNVY